MFGYKTRLESHKWQMGKKLINKLEKKMEKFIYRKNVFEFKFIEKDNGYYDCEGVVYNTHFRESFLKNDCRLKDCKNKKEIGNGLKKLLLHRANIYFEYYFNYVINTKRS